MRFLSHIYPNTSISACLCVSQMSLCQNDHWQLDNKYVIQQTLSIISLTGWYPGQFVSKRLELPGLPLLIHLLSCDTVHVSADYRIVREN